MPLVAREVTTLGKLNTVIIDKNERVSKLNFSSEVPFLQPGNIWTEEKIPERCGWII